MSWRAEDRARGVDSLDGLLAGGRASGAEWPRPVEKSRGELEARRGSGGSLMDRLLLEDVRFYGYHGVTKAEQTTGVWFSVDVELTLDLGPAALSDDLASAVDYGRVAQRIVELGSTGRVNLLERLASLIAETLLREHPTHQVRVKVRKLTAPLGGIHGTPAVELVRAR